MDRTCAAAALDGGQGATRRYLQAGRSLSSTVACHRCNSGCSTRPAASAKASLGHQASRDRPPPHGKIFLHEISELVAIRASNNALLGQFRAIRSRFRSSSVRDRPRFQPRSSHEELVLHADSVALSMGCGLASLPIEGGGGG